MAIVEISFGKGKVILSGAHFEYASTAKDITEDVKHFRDALVSTDKEREIFFAKIVSRLGVPTTTAIPTQHM